jgi:non-heme chloroperoxidase
MPTITTNARSCRSRLAALRSAEIVKGAKLEVYKGAPHGMCTTLKDEVNTDLLAFIKG